MSCQSRNGSVKLRSSRSCIFTSPRHLCTGHRFIYSKNKGGGVDNPPSNFYRSEFLIISLAKYTSDNTPPLPLFAFCLSFFTPYLGKTASLAERNYHIVYQKGRIQDFVREGAQYPIILRQAT